METQIFHHAKNITLKKSSYKTNQNPSRYYYYYYYYNSIITNLKFQHKPKLSSFRNYMIRPIIIIIIIT